MPSKAFAPDGDMAYYARNALLRRVRPELHHHIIQAANDLKKVFSEEKDIHSIAILLASGGNDKYELRIPKRVRYWLDLGLPKKEEDVEAWLQRVCASYVLSAVWLELWGTLLKSKLLTPTEEKSSMYCVGFVRGYLTKEFKY